MANGTIPMSGLKKLWTNANTGASFAAQTVAVDLTGFTAVLINFKETAGDMAGFDYVAPVDTGSHVVSKVSMPSNGLTSYAYSRTVSYSSSGVAFGDALKKTLLSGDRETSNSNMIPSAIYGIA